MSKPTPISAYASPEERLAAYLAAVPCLRILTDRERDRLADGARLVQLARDERLGPESGSLLVLSGRAELVRARGASGRDEVAALLGPGSLCFEERLFGDPAPSTNVLLRPLGALIAARLSPEALAEIGSEESILGRALEALASSGLRRFVEQLAALLSTPLDAATLRTLLEGLHPASFLSGDRLAGAGDPPAGFTVVDSGRARREPSGSQESPRLLVAGDFFGETALCLASPEPATITALTDGGLHRLSARDFERLSAGSSSLRTLLSTLVGCLAVRGHAARLATTRDVEETDEEADADEAAPHETFSREAVAELAPPGTERRLDVLPASPERPAGRRLHDLPEIAGHVRIEQVTFRYGRDLEPALSELSLEILPGERVAVVGRGGAGKSTLAQLLLKRREPDSGAILIDGLDLRAVSPRSLRGQLGLVSHDVDLLAGTINENIAFGRDLTRGEVMDAARAACAHEFIARRPCGYETVVGQRGAERLSRGELQRLAIARALAGKPRLLVLDEPTSALDAESEDAVLRSLEVAVGSGTLVVLSHRLAFARRADRIIVLDRGRAVQHGSHAELLERGGLYALLGGEQSLSDPART